jgi:WD40 repeat protein
VWDTESAERKYVIKDDPLEAINAISVNKSKTVLASAGAQLKLWDITNLNAPKVRFTLRGHEDAVHGVAFSPDGQLLVSASNDESVRLWSVQSGEQKQLFSGHEGAVLAVAWSPDGRLVASGGGASDKSICVWSVDTGKIAVGPLRAHGNSIVGLAFNGDASVLVSGSMDKTIKMWSLKGSPIVLRTLVGHAGAVNSIAYSPDYKLLVSASADRTVRVWDSSTGQQIKEISLGLTNSISSIVWSPDAALVAGGANDKNITVWVAKEILPVCDFLLCVCTLCVCVCL